MTTRRTVLQGVTSLIAPADFPPGDSFRLAAAKSPFEILIGEYRQMVVQLDSLFSARKRIEADASSRDEKFNECPELAVAEKDERAWYEAEKKLIQRGVRTRARSVDEVIQKLILWRLADHDAECLDNPFDMLAFAAYRDLLLLTGRASLTPKADEKCLATIWDDKAFHFEDEEGDAEYNNTDRAEA